MQRDATADRTMELVDALYAFAEQPDRWLDAVEAIERLPAALNGDAARLAVHAERAAAVAHQLNDARRRAAAAVTPWDAVLLSAESQLRAIAGAPQPRLEPFLDQPLAMFDRPAFRADLRAGFAAAMETARAVRHGGLAHWTLTREDTGARCFAIVMARAAFPRDLSSAFGISDMGPEPLFALALLNDEAPPGDHVREGLGLTRAEWRLAEQLKRGLAVADAAAALGVSVNTARTQVKAIFAKLGVSRQSELVGRLSLAGRIAAADPAGARASVDAPPRRFVVLDDGRRLAYREYGDARGKPVIVFHQWFAASLLPLAAIEAARNRGLRLVVFDRPGFGQSTPAAAHTFESVARDTEGLADRLQLPRFALLGTAPGGAFAVAAAARMPDRIAKLALVTPRLSPIGIAPARGRMQRNLIGLLRHPWIIRSLVATLRSGMSDRMAASLVRYASSESNADRAAAADPATARSIMAMGFDAHEATAEGMIAELNLFAGKVLPDPRPLRCPIGVWHGAQDTLVPGGDSVVLFEPLPNATLHILDREGLVFSTAAYRAVFDWIKD